MVQDVLDYAALEGKAEVQANINLNVVLDDLVEHFKVKLNVFGSEISHDNLPHVHAQETQVLQVFTSVFNYCLDKLMTKNTQHIHVYSKESGNEAHVVVSVNSKICEAAECTNLFEMSQSLAANAKLSNARLSLSMCKKIMECNNGQIWAELTDDNCTGFHLVFPKAS